MEFTDNINIKCFRSLISPAQLKDELPETQQNGEHVMASRKAIQEIVARKDGRMMVITGPCSLHDSEATLEYAEKLACLQRELGDRVLLVMRAYFEKPRTTLGWKGMIYDPHLDGSYDIEQGLRNARRLLLEINGMGLPAATEFLDPIVPQYLADQISWAAIGARTTESQIHRQMASGLSMPIGFKNSTDGSLTNAIDAVKAAYGAHSFMGIDREGQVIIAETLGNKYGHLVLRGGEVGPNYGSEYVAFASVLLQKAGIDTGIVIDCSHANSGKDYARQRLVVVDVAEQVRAGCSLIAGIMLESFLEEGKQPIGRPEELRYGISCTDSCIGWQETAELIGKIAEVET